jgi:hypothetical protein
MGERDAILFTLLFRQYRTVPLMLGSSLVTFHSSTQRFYLMSFLDSLNAVSSRLDIRCFGIILLLLLTHRVVTDSSPWLCASLHACLPALPNLDATHSPHHLPLRQRTPPTT